jgi:hypothetical protein
VGVCMHEVCRGDGATITDLPLCQPCMDWASRGVRALPTDHTDLQRQALEGPRVTGQAPECRHVPGPRVPIDLSADEAQRRMVWLALAWEEPVRDRCGLPMLPDGHKRVRPVMALHRAVDVLLPRLDQLCRLDAVDMWDYPGTQSCTATVPGWQGIIDLAACHDRAMRILGLTRDHPELCIGVTCSSCHWRSVLERIPGEDGVLCGRCQRYYTAAEYNSLVGTSTSRATR